MFRETGLFRRAVVPCMSRPRFTNALTATTVGTYALVVLGATTAALESSTTVATLHHLLAVAVGAALAFVVWRVWHATASRQVRASVAVAGLLYPLQAGVGAATYAGVPLASTHLLLAMVIFASLLVALIGHLDTDQRADSIERPGRSDSGAEADSTSTPPRDGIVATVRAYLALTKPRLMWLLCLLALGGMGLAAATGARLDGTTVAATLGGGILAVGASGTFNHLYERDRDKRMGRTDDRPLVSGRVTPRGAACFGLGLAAASIAVMLAFVNPLAAGLTVAAILYYSVVYTVLLKPNTTWSIAIGGGSGALPAVIGWAAVTGGIGIPALLLAAVVVFWTPSHFYNLGIAHRDDYGAASYPMVPVVHGVAPARRRIGYALGATLLTAAGLGAVAGLGIVYAAAVVVGAAVFLVSIVWQYREPTYSATMRSFHASNAFLGLLLVAILVETVLV
ncbi:protoheme IX farnesyltransferase [Natronomonas halophila]|nr:protoheme IX farnesyltransferase [Natronomonas halophila]